jgi:hypothetical protein
VRRSPSEGGKELPGAQMLPPVGLAVVEDRSRVSVLRTMDAPPRVLPNRRPRASSTVVAGTSFQRPPRSRTRSPTNSSAVCIPYGSALYQVSTHLPLTRGCPNAVASGIALALGIRKPPAGDPACLHRLAVVDAKKLGEMEAEGGGG